MTLNQILRGCPPSESGRVMQTLRLDQKVITNEISLNRNIYTSSSLASVRPLAQLLPSLPITSLTAYFNHDVIM